MTTKKTLQSEPESMLAKMFSGELVPGTQDEQEAYMLDRNPKYFEPILNYLRTTKLVIDPNVSMEGVLADAWFFGIQSLVDQIKKLKKAEETEKLKKAEEIEKLKKTKERDEQQQLRSLTNIEAQLKDISENIESVPIIQAHIMQRDTIFKPSTKELEYSINICNKIKTIANRRKNKNS